MVSNYFLSIILYDFYSLWPFVFHSISCMYTFNKLNFFFNFVIAPPQGLTDYKTFLGCSDFCCAVSPGHVKKVLGKNNSANKIFESGKNLRARGPQVL